MRALFFALALCLSTSAFAASKTYQVTGEVVDISDSKIVINKAGEKFEMDRTPTTKVTGELKKGGKATVWYSMTAQEAEAKEAKTKK